MPKIRQFGICPECGADWCGGDIPKNLRKHYSRPYKWSRLIGIEDPFGYDGASYWKCPDCETYWDRFTGKKVKKPNIEGT